jgi:hypothetical protein
MITYKILRADGSEEIIETETRMELKAMQEVVGGWIEAVPSPLEFGIFTEGYVYSNEDGKAQNLPRNLHGTIAPNGDFLVGNLLVVEGDPDNDADEEEDE